jgi:PTH1 family peptidyl-tRNA hydrolase
MIQKSLIVGLGNPGSEYDNTRHNIGFSVLDAWAQASNFSFEQVRHGWRAETKWKGRPIVLLKPNTYMNLSGKAVKYWMDQEGRSADQIMVVTDDIALPFGTIRIRKQGSDGGHNGLKDIIRVLGHAGFPRLRFGVGGDFPKGMQAEYVLGKWSEQELKQLIDRMPVVIGALKSFSTAGIGTSMNQFNGK